MKIRNFDETTRLDHELYRLASYEVTHGMIIVPHSLGEVVDLQEKIAKRFNYFKRLIRTGECTFEFIKRNVLQDNGPFVQEELSLDDPDYFNKLSVLDKEIDKEIDECEPDKLPKNLVLDILRELRYGIKDANKRRPNDKEDIKMEADPLDVDSNEFLDFGRDEKSEEDVKTSPKKKKEEDTEDLI